MNTTVIVGSVTIAIKVRKMLLRSGIASKLVKVDGDTNEKGCLYGVKFSSGYFYDVVALLKNNNLNYQIKGDGM